MSGTALLTTLAEEIQEVATPAFATAVSCENLADTLAEVVARAEELLQRELPGTERERQACGPGCGSCCVVNVAVLFPEGAAIAHHVVREWSTDRRKKLQRRLEDLYLATRWLDDDDRVVLRRPCAFLDEEDLCSIHPVRPLLCRAVTSLDRDACREAVAAACFGEIRPIQMNLLQKGLMETAFASTGRALAASGHGARSFRLTSLVRHLLTFPAAVTDYLAGRMPTGL